MRKILMMIAAFLAIAGCTKDDGFETGPSKSNDSMTVASDTDSTVVTFNLNDGWTATIGPFRGSSRRASIEDLGMTDVWMMAYSGGVLAKTIHQSSTDDDFGSISVTLKYGDYILYFVSSRGSSPSLDTSAKTITWASVRDTFWKTMNVTVSKSSDGSFDVDMNRIVGKLRLIVTDEVPENATVFKVAPSHWYYGFNYQTGEPMADGNSPISVTIPATYIGTKDLNVSVYGICPSSDWSTDIAASLMSGSSVLGSVTLDDVPMQRNHITTYSGSLLGKTQSMTLSSSEEWITDDVHTW